MLIVEIGPTYEQLKRSIFNDQRVTFFKALVKVIKHAIDIITELQMFDGYLSLIV